MLETYLLITVFFTYSNTISGFFWPSIIFFLFELFKCIIFGFVNVSYILEGEFEENFYKFFEEDKEY